jgi:hypothetical protein
MINVTFRPLYPRDKIPVHIEGDAGWAPDGVWMCLKVIKSSTGIRTTDRPSPDTVALTTTPSVWVYINTKTDGAPSGMSVFMIDCGN